MVLLHSGQKKRHAKFVINLQRIDQRSYGKIGGSWAEWTKSSVEVALKKTYRMNGYFDI